MSLLRRIVAFSLVLSLPVGLVYSTIITGEEIPTQENQFMFSQDNLLPLLPIEIAGPTQKNQFQFSKDNLPPLLPVEVGGRKYPFVVDTGSSVTVYDAAFRPLLGEPIESGVMNTSNDRVKVVFYSSPRAHIGHFSLTANSPVLCMDLGGIRKSVNEYIYGILGMDYLGRYVFRIDFDRGELTFLRSADMDSGIRIPITYHNGIPQVQATIPGLVKSELFRVDTGNAHKGHGDLRDELFDSLCEKRVLIPAGQQLIVTLSGSELLRQGRLQEISLGCFSQQDLLFCRSFKHSSLGINYWSRYIITFDFPNRAIYLKKRKMENEKWEKEKRKEDNVH